MRPDDAERGEPNDGSTPVEAAPPGRDDARPAEPSTPAESAPPGRDDARPAEPSPPAESADRLHGDHRGGDEEQWDDVDWENGPPLVLPRLRRLGVIAVILAPLLVVTLSSVGMPGGFALLVFLAGLVATVAWRDQDRRE